MPMFPASYYEKLDPSYLQALQSLENDLITDRKELRFKNVSRFSELILEFSLIYLMPKKFWQMLWKHVYKGHDLHEIINQTWESILPSIVYHFSFWQGIRNYIPFFPRRKLLKSNIFADDNHGFYSVEQNIEYLCLPHDMPEYYLHKYENGADSHMPKKIIKRYLKARKLYDKIIAVKDNEEEWIAALIEANDIEFVKHNIEYRLGEDLTNKQLWILYIKYLKENDIQELLQTYSKYCRFFVDDIAMNEEYKKAAEQYGKPIVPWKNAFDFEIYDENLLKLKPPEFLPQVLASNLPCPIFFDFSQTMLSQRFPFHSNLIDYILKTAKARELQNLNFSCKFFYSKYRIPVCYSLDVSRYSERCPKFSYKKESLSFASNFKLEKMNFDKLYISMKLSYGSTEIPLRNMIPKFYCCNAKFIEISNQELTVDEFKFFVGHGNVITLNINRVKIIGNNSERLYLEDIVSLTPKLQNLYAFEPLYSSTTAQKLCELPFENKFMHISLRRGINHPLEPDALGEFVNKNASPNCQVYIDGIDGNFKRAFKSVINNYWNERDKPSITLDTGTENNSDSD